MIQLPSLQTAPFFSLSFLFLSYTLSVFSGNIPVFSSCAPSLLHLLPPPHLLFPLLRAGGRGAITHHLVITGTKGALVALGCGRSWCTATGEKWSSPPPFPIPSSPPSSPPPQMMKTLSERIRKERCALAEGKTVIKAVPPHLCTSIPLSTYSLFVTLYQFWDSKPFVLLSKAPELLLIFTFFM